MLEKNDLVRDTIRMFLSEVQRYEIDNKEEVDDTKALKIINKMIKQRNDSISQFTDGGRDDLADKEQSEVDILSKYKPAQLSEEEVVVKVNEAIYTFVAVNKRGKPVKVPLITPQTDLEKTRYDAALRRRQLSLVLAGKMSPSEATELKAIFD